MSQKKDAKCREDARLTHIETQNRQFDGEIGSLVGFTRELSIECGDVEARSKCRDMDLEKRLAEMEAWKEEHEEHHETSKGMASQKPDLRVGDWAVVINPELDSYRSVGKVTYIGGTTRRFQLNNSSWYNSDSLHKLPDEIARQLNGGRA